MAEKQPQETSKTQNSIYRNCLEHAAIKEQLSNLWQRHKELIKVTDKLDIEIEERRKEIDAIKAKITYGVFMIALSMMASLFTLIAVLAGE